MEFIRYCHKTFEDKEKELNNVKLLEDYYNKTSIWWYTCESFLYPMLNHLLRVLDTDIIIKLGFFIKDLLHHIEKLYHEQFNAYHSDESLTYGNMDLVYERIKELFDGISFYEQASAVAEQPFSKKPF